MAINVLFKRYILCKIIKSCGGVESAGEKIKVPWRSVFVGGKAIKREKNVVNVL